MKRLLKKLLTKNIVGISSGGGHLNELQSSLSDKIKKDVIYITFKNGHTQKSLKHYKHYFIIDPHNSKIKYIINFIQSLFLFVKLRPKIIISTGAGIAIPFILIGKFFGSKIIFIETGARIYTPSKTGKFIYKFADLFFIQYNELQKEYPNAIIGSLK